MLIALARFWSAALTPTALGLTSSATSRSPPAFRAVTVPPPPSPVAATATLTSPDAPGEGVTGGIAMSGTPIGLDGGGPAPGLYGGGPAAGRAPALGGIPGRFGPRGGGCALIGSTPEGIVRRRAIARSTRPG